MSHPKVAIIILNWNGKKDTLELLSSAANIDYPEVEVIVVDNGSKDDSVAAIRRQHPYAKIVQNSRNLGFAEGNNVGIRYALDAGFDFIFILNNDTIVSSDIVQSFVDQMHKEPEVGILGAKIFLYEEKNKFDHLGGQWNLKKGCFDLIALRELDDGIAWEESQELDYVCGCAFFVRREVFEKIGLFEEKFFLIWEESDLCFRARRKGFKVQTCPKAKVWHKVSASFVGGKPHSTYFWWRNRLLWIERNCSFNDSLRLYLRILIPDILHIFKLRLLKSMQLFLLRIVRPRESLKRRQERNLKYKAALHGVRDYLLRRFGNGPSWLYKEIP
jgi:GT2 family glycosyltransferase